MNRDRVSQKMAQRLKGVWKWETELYYVGGILCYHVDCKPIGTEILPCPSLGELRERLTYDDFLAYPVTTDRYNWLYEVTADADALAEVWLETQPKLTPEEINQFERARSVEECNKENNFTLGGLVKKEKS